MLRLLNPPVLARGLSLSGMGLLLRRLRTWNGVLGLAYHRIGDGTGSLFDRGLWSADADTFDAQVRFLQKHFDLITPDELPDRLVRRHGRYVLITFDDGYRDNYETAFPVLKARGAPATFFVTTGFLDSPRLPWWDEIAWMVRTSQCSAVAGAPWLPAPVPFDEPHRERALRRLLRVYKDIPGEETAAYLDFLAEATGSGRHPGGAADALWMTWDMVRQMRSAGMCIGGHTVNHPVLGRLSRDRQEGEIAECGRRLRTELGEPMTCFSYPVGGPQAFNADTRACLEAQGVRFAFSYYGGFRRFDDWDPYDVRRLRVETDTSPAAFRAAATLPQLFA